MRRRTLTRWGLLGLGAVLAAGESLPHVEAAPLPPWDDAAIEARIRAYRTAPLRLRLRLRDRDDRPLARYPVAVRHLRHRMQFGTALHRDLSPRPDEDPRDHAHREAWLRLCNAATVTFYWATYEPRPGEYDDAPLQAKIDWLKQHEFYVRGHPLCWNHVPACLPAWLRDRDVTVAETQYHLERLLDHLSTAIFPRLDEVDVFNELTAWERFEHPLTDWLAAEGKISGATRFLQAFKQRNPHVKAALNDFTTGPAYARLLRDLIAAGAPLDTIGQQSHMFGGNWPLPGVWNLLERLRQVGGDLPIVLTETSVLAGEVKSEIDFGRTYTDWHSTPEGEQQQADYLEAFYRLAFSHPRVAGIYLWSFSDREAWLGAPTGILRADGSKKPAYERLERLINRDWRTQGTFSTDDKGDLLIPHAFVGDYRLEFGDTAIAIRHDRHAPARIEHSLG